MVKIDNCQPSLPGVDKLSHSQASYVDIHLPQKRELKMTLPCTLPFFAPNHLLLICEASSSLPLKRCHAPNSKSKKLKCNYSNFSKAPHVVATLSSLPKAWALRSMVPPNAPNSLVATLVWHESYMVLHLFFSLHVMLSITNIVCECIQPWPKSKNFSQCSHEPRTSCLPLSHLPRSCLTWLTPITICL